MCDFNKEIFDAGFDLKGTHLVEASAGTGKTYNIQNIYARLIMETDFRVANILVMTFTEAATKELRERLYMVLTDIKSRFDGKDCDGKDDKDIQRRNQRADDLINIGDPTPEQKKVKLLRVELALAEFDNAAISTIHGFCQRVLKRYAFETGIGFNQGVSDDKAAGLGTAIADWWRINYRKTDIELNTLKKCVGKLSSKADYKIDPDIEDPGKGICDVAEEIVEKYENGRLERENLNFDDLLRVLRDVLKRDAKECNADFAKKLREEYKAAVVDEFQDTDSVQYDIIKYIFMDENDPHPLYFVGDPKQAIYAFRGGDIYTYFKAAGSVSGKHTLKVNYRSPRPLIDIINRMFEETDRGQTFSYDEIAYGKVDPDPEKISGITSAKPFQIARFDHLSNTSVAACMTEIINTIVRYVSKKLNSPAEKGDRPLAPKDIAILMGSKTHMQAVHDALARVGIPSVIQDSGNVFKTSAAKELLVFLTGVKNAGVKNLQSEIRAAALTVFGGVAPENAAAELDDPDNFAKHIERLKDMREVWLSRGFPALVSYMEQEDHCYLLRIAEKPNGERMLSDVGQIIELCCAATRTVGDLPENLICWLNDRIVASNDDEVDAEEFQRELEVDGDAVRIMTIHSSKGLQFPVVVLPDCWNLFNGNDPRNRTTDFFCYHNEKNELVFVYAESGCKKEKATEEMRRERIRLLYVALTRAEQQMLVFVPEPFSSEEIKRKEPLIALLKNLGGNDENALSNVFSAFEYQDDITEEIPYYNSAKTGENVELAALEAPDYGYNPVRGSYSALSFVHSGNDDARDCDDELRLFHNEVSDCEHAIFKVPGGARIGTCWHNIMEKISFDADDDAIKTISEVELTGFGFSDAGVLDQTIKMVRKTLDQTLTSPNKKTFALKDIPWKDRLSEQEFDFSTSGACRSTIDLSAILKQHWSGDATKTDFIEAMEKWDNNIPKGFMTGFIDLIFRRDGYYYIVDWKSNMLDQKVESFSAARIRTEMAGHRYFFQYMLYAAVLHRYLKMTLGDNYSWDKNFGGIRYYFLRGIAAGKKESVFVDRPSEKLLDEFSKALGMAEIK